MTRLEDLEESVRVLGDFQLRRSFTPASFGVFAPYRIHYYL
jgi:hypothetical protein